MRKAPDAFRTISEASDALQTPAHVLRFWESKFSQIKPVKRAGGRRYYRPADIDLLSGIKTLLHDQGMTIRGVQKLLVEKGARHVAQMAVVADLNEDAVDAHTNIVDLHPTAKRPAHDADKSQQMDTPPSQPESPAPDATAGADAEAAPDDAPTAAPPEDVPESAALPTDEVPDSAATAPVPPPSDASPKSDIDDAGPRNAFANLGSPKRRAQIRPAALAHALRQNVPQPERLKQAAPLVARLEALLARMQKAG
ncbi:MAG: MerR family transcriptional regulator [Roseinatronobacter sp.]|nr:MAG: MerR family transcriptional regulator [Roseinatronobacter sp.]